MSATVAVPIPWAPLAATALFLVLLIWAVMARKKG